MSVEKSVKKRRSAIKIMGQLIGLVAPLLHIMLLAILLGAFGYLCAIFLTILASQVLLKGLGEPATVFSDMSIKNTIYYYGNGGSHERCASLCGAVLQSFYCI